MKRFQNNATLDTGNILHLFGDSAKGEITDEPGLDQAREAFDGQAREEVIEVDEHGQVHRPRATPRSNGRKPTILHDPKGEYSGQ